MNTIIRVGIAGFGMSGQIFQAPFLHADKRFQIKKVYERTTEKAKKEYPYVEIVRTYQELLTEDIDLIIISTPNMLHAQMAKEAMHAGKNVIVEKPVATTSMEAEELCLLAKEKGVLFSVYQNRRLDGDFLTLKNLIDSNSLGEVLDYEVHYDRYVRGKSSKEWKENGGPGIGILYDLGVHIIDQAVYLFGLPNEIYADFRKQRDETVGYDNFEVILYYKDKKAIISASEVVAGSGPHYMVHGRDGSYLKYGMDVQENALIAGERPGKDGWGEESAECYGTLYRNVSNRIEETKIKTIAGNYGKYYDNIYDALTSGAELLVKPDETVMILKIIEAAARSNAEKRRVVF